MYYADPLKSLRAMFDAALAAVKPEKYIAECLSSAPRGKVTVIGAGKASGIVAKAVEAHWKEKVSGAVIVPYGYSVKCRKIKVFEGAHPIPDAMGIKATKYIYSLVKHSCEDDLILGLFSGGGSSLLTMPASGVTLSEKKALNDSLLRSGAKIQEINTVRKHLSKIKGGHLAKIAGKTRIINLLISDVPGNDPSVIASGPTVPDTSTLFDAQEVIKKYKIKVPKSISAYLNTEAGETPNPNDSCFNNNKTYMIATPAQSLKAAESKGNELGFRVYNLGDSIEGEARYLGKKHARLSLAYKKGLELGEAPCVILSGGETTVTISGNGCGGPNTEYLMGLMIGLKGANGIYAMACDTDGIDGIGRNAGAIIKPNTLLRAEKMGLSAERFLKNNDSYNFFKKLGNLIITGPTYTNINDFRAILILP